MATITAAADGSHRKGAMIALLPSREDAGRLAVDGGEPPEELHLTLYFLGTGGDYDETARAGIVSSVTEAAGDYVGGPVTAKAFGANHWNAGSDSPSWVWAVGDQRSEDRDEDAPLLTAAREAAAFAVSYAIRGGDVDPDVVPEQHSPWAPHICAAYSEDPALLPELEARLGTVTFDRIRVTFAGDATDIPLGGQVTASVRAVPSAWEDKAVRVEVATTPGGDLAVSAVRAALEAASLPMPIHVTGRTHTRAPVTAAGLLRRNPTDLEVRSRVDFADMDRAWRDAVDETVAEWAAVEEAWRGQIRTAVQAAVTADDLGRLDTFTVDTADAGALLYARMSALAQTAGEEQQREAEEQGVTVPRWSLGGGTEVPAVTAAGVRDRLRQIARATARLLGVSLVQSAVRRVMRLFGSGSTGTEVAEDVDRHLAGMSGAFVRENVGAAMTGAQNEGRMTVLAAAPPAAYWATEILDRSSCKPCRDVDGTGYTSLADAQAAYPFGGYAGCLGGPRCRGTLVAVWGEDTATATVARPAREAAPAVLPAPGTGGNETGTTMQQTSGREGGGVEEPYSIVQGHPDCADGTPWAVVSAEGELMGCHATEGEAAEQLDGLCQESGPDFAGVLPGEDAPPRADPGAQLSAATAPWRGPLAIEDETTGDGREFAPESLTWADLPVPLRWNKEDSHGGEPTTVAVNVGRIDRIWREGSQVMGEGVLDLGNEDGREVHRKIIGKFLRGVSIDADSIADADVEFVWPADIDDGPGDGDQDDDLFSMLFAQPEKVIYHAGRIRAATLVDIPAFAGAFIELLDDQGAVVAAGAPATAEECGGAARPGGTHPSRRSALTASPGSGAWRPPAAWFADPGLPFYTGITVTDEGRVFGHAAPWGACHIGFDGQCITAPREDHHSHYMTGEVVCDDGSRAAVGQVTVGTGHAPLHLGAVPATEHYDDTGTAVADVAVGNDVHGIWVAGAVRPAADPLSVYELRASGRVSGDWRRIGGRLRLVGLLAVNVAGFQGEVPRMRARTAGGAPQALVAAGLSAGPWTRSWQAREQQAVRTVLAMLRRRVHEGR